MADTAADNSRMLKDTVLYMLAKAVEGIAGILTLTALTYLFIDDELGSYTLWNTTATTAAMLSIQWLSQSAARYLNDYEYRKEGVAFYSTVFSAWLKTNVIALASFAFAGFLLNRLTLTDVPGFIGFMYGGSDGEGFLGQLFALAALYFVSYNTSQLLIALLSVKRKVYANLFISSLSSVGKLALILLFARIFGAYVWIVFLSYIVCDFLVIVFALFVLSALKYVKRKSCSGKLMSNFGKYGTPLVGNLAATTVLNSSDRYIITHFWGKAQVGIYMPNYNTVSSVFTMLQTALMRGSYPTILKTYASGDREQTEILVSMAVRNYLIVAVPAVVGLGVLARPLSFLLFNASYVSGSGVIVWVAAGMAFLGLTEYSNKPWELSAKTWMIFRNSFASGIVNLLINIIFVPRYGYMVAAYSTFISFFIYFCLSKYGSRKLMRWRLGFKTYASIAASALLMGVCLFLALRLLGATRLTLFAYVLAGIIIYGAVLAVSGEINGEIEMVKRFLNNRGLKK